MYYATILLRVTSRVDYVDWYHTINCVDIT